ncbi:MAG: class D sortase [Acidobacteriota bacterium]
MRIRIRPNVFYGAAVAGAGAALLAYVATIVLMGAWMESRDRFELAATLTQGVPLLAVPDPRGRGDKQANGAHVIPIAPSRTTVSSLGLGIVEIDRLGLSVLIRGTSTAADLDKGAGWIKGTARPGDAGNVGVAGHRDTFFRDLRGVKAGDEVRLLTPAGPRVYTVTETMIVEPSNTSVLRQTATPTLTLITCFPFDFIGAAPKRFVVRATGTL